VHYRSILLVEDNAADEELTLRAFTKNKIRNPITVARDGAEALERLLTGDSAGRMPPALILLDLQLPKIDGFEVLRRIRSHQRTRFIPAVILTSSGLEEDILAGYQAGANAYVRKPVNFTDFVGAIGALAMFWLLFSEPPPHAISPAPSGAPSAERGLVQPAAAGTDPAGRGAMRILILEDNPADAELALRLLTRAGVDFAAVVADSRESYVRQLTAFQPDVILTDYSLPGFSGEGALKIAQDQCPDTPVIVLSGVIGDEAAAEFMRQGATDYILKDRLARLAPVVRRAVAEAEQRSQLVRLEAHLERAQRMESIGRLAAGVAHEFNNQVGIMLNYAAFISREAAEKTQQGANDESWDGIRRDAEKIEQAGRRVIKLVHQLLTAGSNAVIRAEVIDLNQVVGGIDELLRSSVGAGIELQVSLDPDLLPVSADPGQIGQVILNLTMNAGEAMPDGGSLTVETQNASISPGEAAELGLTPGDYVCLSTSDTGVGMEPGVLEHVFEPFFTTKPFVEGGGLGLASVYGIIRQSGGTVRISSAPGAGTAVTLWLPAAAGLRG
jgi:two-component system, cell cycle sensor histidine kinase and response regulator CckA